MISHGRLGRPWTPYEDEMLRAAVLIHGDNTEKWKTIALSVPGRTNKACRKRWLHSLSPSVKKCAWTAEEDGLLLAMFEKYPNKWSQIARQIPGRTDDACSKRYREALDPKLKKDEWTEEEDRQLLDALPRHGGPCNPKWGLIGQELRRSGLGCRNRWRLLQRKKNAVARQVDAPQAQVQARSTDVLPQLMANDHWPLSVEEMSLSFWSSDWTVVDAGLHFPGTSDVAPDLPLASVSDGGSSGEPVVTMRTGSSDPHGIIAGGLPEGTFLHANEASQTNNMPNDGGPSPDDGSYVYYDDCEDGSLNDNRTSNSASLMTEDCDGTSNNERMSSLGTLAHAAAASTLSPGTPQAPLPSAAVVVPPPRKRRRAHVHPPAVSGMCVLSDLVASQKKPAPKLSSSLPVAGDPSILAYACGHSACASQPTSVVSFSVSGDLLHHYKQCHMADLGACDESPFRCGLQGCNKAWKSINGLQYHLQISKVHYQDICSRAAAVNKQPVVANNDPAAPSGDVTPPAEAASRASTKRLHRCPHPGCAKEYKQLSGLRYHMLHGHPKDMPTQLGVAPPRLATQLGMGASGEAPANAVPPS